MQCSPIQLHISQLEESRRSYFYARVSSETVAKFPKGKATRLICILNKELSFQCGRNHMGDGDFFMILAERNLMKLGLRLGDHLTYEIEEDLKPLGVYIPEVLKVLLD